MVNKIWKFKHKIYYNLACIGDMSQVCTRPGILEVSKSNGVIQIAHRSILVVMVMKFYNSWNCTGGTYIRRMFLHHTKVLEVPVYVNKSNFSRTDHCCWRRKDFEI